MRRRKNWAENGLSGNPKICRGRQKKRGLLMRLKRNCQRDRRARSFQGMNQYHQMCQRGGE
jgi:hypothetical protein